MAKRHSERTEDKVPYLQSSSKGQVCFNALPPVCQRSSCACRATSIIAPHTAHKDACNLSSTCCHTPKTRPWLLAAISHLSIAAAYCPSSFLKGGEPRYALASQRAPMVQRCLLHPATHGSRKTADALCRDLTSGVGFLSSSAWGNCP